jgi:c-di-GMP-related signal transduction protein
MNISKTFTSVELVSLAKVIALGGYKVEMDDVISSLHVTLPDLTSYATIMSVRQFVDMVFELYKCKQLGHAEVWQREFIRLVADLNNTEEYSDADILIAVWDTHKGLAKE